MIHYIIGQLLNTVILLALGIMVYLKNRKSPVNILFALFSLAGSMWSFSFFQMTVASNPGTGLFWARVLHVGAILIPVFFLHFTLEMIGNAQQKKNLLKVAYGLAGVFLLLIPTPYFVSHTVAIFNFKYFVGPAGPMYHTFPIFFLLCVLYAFYSLFLG
jgi:hypothetical protein